MTTPPYIICIEKPLLQSHKICLREELSPLPASGYLAGTFLPCPINFPNKQGPINTTSPLSPPSTRSQSSASAYILYLNFNTTPYLPNYQPFVFNQDT